MYVYSFTLSICRNAKHLVFVLKCEILMYTLAVTTEDRICIICGSFRSSFILKILLSHIYGETGSSQIRISISYYNTSFYLLSIQKWTFELFPHLMRISSVNSNFKLSVEITSWSSDKLYLLCIVEICIIRFVFSPSIAALSHCVIRVICWRQQYWARRKKRRKIEKPVQICDMHKLCAVVCSVRLYAVNLRIVKLNSKANCESQWLPLGNISRNKDATAARCRHHNLRVTEIVSLCRIPHAAYRKPHARIVRCPLYKFGAGSSSASVTLNDKTNYEIFKMLNFCWSFLFLLFALFYSFLAAIQLVGRRRKTLIFVCLAH